MDNEPVVDTVVEPVVVERNYTSEAELQGWVPKEKYRGDEESWVDAKAFVQRGEQINPILKKNNERLLHEIEKQKKEVAELRKATEEFKKFQKESYDRKAQQLETELKSLREEKKLAITQGDGERAVAIDDKIDAIKEEKASAKQESKETPPPQEHVDPEIAAWVDKNKWYSNDIRMAAAANVIAEDIKRSKPWLTGTEFLSELDIAIEENFSPERLGKQTKQKARSPVEAAAPSSPNNKNDKGYASLPPEAKAACDDFVKQKLMTREEYVAIFNEQ